MTVTAAASASVAVTGVELNKTSDTILVGGTTTLAATVSPSDATNQNVSWASDNTAVATVDANGVVTGVAAGTANITVTTEDGAYTASCAVTVNESTKNNAANITLSLTNPYSDDNAGIVLVGTNANLSVIVTDENGNAVANAPVVLTSKDIDGISSTNTAAYYNSQQNLTETVLYTDENGTATFVYGSKKSKDDDGAVDALRTDYVASYTVTATVAGSNVSSDLYLGFAAFSIDGVSKTAPTDLTPGTNASEAGETTGTRTTTDGNNKSETYVYSQQVSSGDTSHAVTLGSSATLVLPDTESESAASTVELDVNYVSGSYGIYASNWKQSVVTEVSVSELQYATVYFTDFDLSEYTSFTIQAYVVPDANDIWTDASWVGYKTITGDDVTTGEWSWQIPLGSYTEGYLMINYGVESKGQVNTAHNTGYTLSKVVGVRNSSTSQASTSDTAKDITISWAEDSGSTWTAATEIVKYSDSYSYYIADDSSTWVEMTNIVSKIETAGYTAKAGYTWKVQVPAFPRTGNALITVYDSNKDVVAYYTAATKNNDSNINIVDDTDYSTSDVTYSVCYKITEAEAKNQVGTVTDNGDGTVTVDTTTTGVTHLIATISSTNEDITIDASNEHLYTSVQWNPIPNTTDTSSTTVAALVSQTATVVAQLVDKEGNAVTESNVGITFSATAMNEGTEKTGDLEAGESIDAATVLSITNDGKTDTKGQVTMTLSANEIETVNNITATSTSNNYNVTFTVGSISATSLNVMWIDPNVAYTASTYSPVGYATTSQSSPAATAETTYNAGETWINGVYFTWEGEKPGTLGTTSTSNLAGNFTSGVTSVISIADGSVGTTDLTTANQVTLTSTAAGTTTEKFALTKNSYASSIGIYCTDNYATYTYVGSGEVDNDKSLELEVTWKASGVSAKYVLPTGKYATVGTDKVGYLRIVDAYGNAITDAKNVTLKVASTNKGITIVSGAAISAGGNQTVASDTYQTSLTLETANCGLIAFKLDGASAVTNDTATVTATVEGTSISVSTTFKWVTASEKFAVESASYDNTAKTLTLTFNQELVSEITAVSLGAISFTDTNSGETTTYTPSSAVISGKTLVITMPNTFSKDISNETSFSFTTAEWVNYNTSDKSGDSVTYTIASATTGQVLEGTFTVIANGGTATDGKVSFTAAE